MEAMNFSSNNLKHCAVGDCVIQWVRIKCYCSEGTMHMLHGVGD